MDISVVIPLYNERDSLPELYARLTKVLTGMRKEYELVFVDDGSTDGSLKVLAGLHEKDPLHVSVYSFRRNYGKSAALATGFDAAKGDFVVTLDADLQDDPAEIPRMIAMLG